MRRLLTVFACIFLSIISQVQAQETATPISLTDAPHGTVSGRIANGTAASSVPADLNVTLFIRDSQSKQTAQQSSTTSGADGSFSFTDIPLSPNYEYAAAVAYRQRAFSTEWVAGNAAGLNLPITLYELTEDPSVLTVSSTKIQVTAAETKMEVQQVIEFNNHSDRVFTGSTGLGDGRYPSVIVSLPPGAVAVGYDSPSRYQTIQQSYTVLDTAPVFPGDHHSVVIVYIMPYDGNAAVIEQPFNYPFEGKAHLITWPDSVTIKSDQLTATGTENANDRTYKAYDATLKLGAGDVLRYEISGKVSAETLAAAQSNSNPGGIVVLVAIILVALGVVVIILYLRGKQSSAPSKDQLIDAITRQIETLDQQHKSGQLNHDIWHRQRAALQTRLNQLTGEEAREQL